MNKTTDYNTFLLNKLFQLLKQYVSTYEKLRSATTPLPSYYTSTNTENCLSTHMSYEFMLLQTANCTVGYKSLVPASIHRGYLPLQYRHLS